MNAELDDLAAANEFAARAESLLADVRIDAFLVPLNRTTQLALVREALDGGRVFEPEFKFSAPSPQLLSDVAELRDAVALAGPWTALVREDLDLTSLQLEAIASRDAHTISSATAELYGTPTDDVVRVAHDIVASAARVNPGEGDEKLSASETAEAICDTLKSASLGSWSVQVEPEMNARMSVRSLDQTVRVRADATFPLTEVRRLLVHELGTHVLRAENGKRQPFLLFRTGFPRYLATEEGLACWHESVYFGADVDETRRFALRVIAADTASRAPFFQTCAELAEHCSVDDAIEIVMRVKRGIADSRIPGCYWKDHVYLTGLIAVRDHLAARAEDHAAMLCGKVGLDHLDLVRSMLDARLLEPPLLHPSAFVSDGCAT